MPAEIHKAHSRLQWCKHRNHLSFKNQFWVTQISVLKTKVFLKTNEKLDLVDTVLWHQPLALSMSHGHKDCYQQEVLKWGACTRKTTSQRVTAAGQQWEAGADGETEGPSKAYQGGLSLHSIFCRASLWHLKLSAIHDRFKRKELLNNVDAEMNWF